MLVMPKCHGSGATSRTFTLLLACLFILFCFTQAAPTGSRHGSPEAGSAAGEHGHNKHPTDSKEKADTRKAIQQFVKQHYHKQLVHGIVIPHRESSESERAKIHTMVAKENKEEPGQYIEINEIVNHFKKSHEKEVRGHTDKQMRGLILSTEGLHMAIFAGTGVGTDPGHGKMGMKEVNREEGELFKNKGVKKIVGYPLTSPTLDPRKFFQDKTLVGFGLEREGNGAFQEHDHTKSGEGEGAKGGETGETGDKTGTAAEGAAGAGAGAGAGGEGADNTASEKGSGGSGEGAGAGEGADEAGGSEDTAE